MSYYNQLHPWCIIQCLPRARTIITARFCRRPDAEAYLRVLRRLTPTATYDLIFDVSENNTESSRENGDRPDAFSVQSLFSSFSSVEMN